MKRPPCTICRSPKWTKTSLGFYVCGNGHYLQGVIQEEIDYEVKIKLREIRNKKKEPTIVKERVWCGVKSIHLKYKAFQFVLRHQIYVMIHHFGLPSEFEKIVQELWLLYVNIVNPTHDPIADQTKETATKGVSVKEEIEFENETLSSYGSDPEQDEMNKLDTEETIKMETDENHENSSNLKYSDPRSKLLLQYSLVFIYLGCVWCRWPITIGDIHRWAYLGLLPLHNLKFPESMGQHFPPMFVSKFFTLNTFPSLRTVRWWTATFVNLYHLEYGLEFPEINSPLILSRYIHELLLPVEFYYAADNLAHLLSLDYHLPTKFMTANLESTFPDIKLMAIVLITAKSCYGLDDKNSKEDGVFSSFPSKKAWLAELKNKYSEELTSEIPWEPGYVKLFAESNLDDFLQYCRENFTLEKQSKYSKQLKSVIQVNHPSLDASSQRVQAITRIKKLFAQPLSDLSEEPSISKFGEDYIIYHVKGLNNEDPESYHGEYAQILVAAAKILGSSLGSLQKVVGRAERKVQALWPKIKNENEKNTSFVEIM